MTSRSAESAGGAPRRGGVRRILPGLSACSVLIALVAIACRGETPPARAPVLDSRATAFLDTLEERTFRWFWEVGDSTTGLTPDRWPTRSFVSVGAVGFALTAYPIGAERGWITREQARERVLRTLRFLWAAPHDSSASATGYRGFFYHFLEPGTGRRFEQVELSTMDSALLFAGALFCQSYFGRDEPDEATIRALADSLYLRADWRWAQVRPPGIVLGWHPERGHLPYDWGGLNETAVLHILALGSPTHPAGRAAWDHFTKGYRWGVFHGQAHIGFAPLFGHQYSQVWIDFRGIHDDTTRARGIDYFENSRRATLAQQRYAIANPSGFTGYGERFWGLTACDGPVDGAHTLAGRERRFRTYAARGASFTEVIDDGTVAPTAAAGSIAFAPEIVIPTLIAMRERYGEHLFGRYGFVDALNPTLDADVKVQHGRVVPGVGWFDTDYLGIDQGPIVAMIENHRSGLVWSTMRRNPHIRRGLEAAGFTGGWLDSMDRR